MSLTTVVVVGGVAAIAYLAMSGNGGNDGFGGGLGPGGGDEEEAKKDDSKEPSEPSPIFKTTSEISGDLKKGDVTASRGAWESFFDIKDEYGEQTPTTLATGDYSRPAGKWTILGPTHAENPYYAIQAAKKAAMVGNGGGKTVGARAWLYARGLDPSKAKIVHTSPYITPLR